jgi:RNA polymerase sigma-70 factor (ECF subfamily)
VVRASNKQRFIPRPVSTAVVPEAQGGNLADLDTQLMLQVREGSRDAFNLLVRRNFECVFRHIARLVRDPRSAEDLTQDVFVQVYVNARRYEPSAKLSTWLNRIATNTALNYLDQAYIKKRRKRDPGVTDPDLAGRSGPPPDYHLDREEQRASVWEAIGTLPDNQRVALTLFQYAGLSCKQIAAVLDTTAEAVRCLLKRARDTLMHRLGGLM